MVSLAPVVPHYKESLRFLCMGWTMSSRKRRLYETTDGVYLLTHCRGVIPPPDVVCRSMGISFIYCIQIIGRIPPQKLWIPVSYADIG